MTDRDPLEMDIRRDDGPAWRRLSPIWLVPILAIAVAVALAWRTYADRGTEIRIAFENASGVVAGETTVRYRDVIIGQVERVTFTADLSQVVVAARIDAAVARTIPPDAQFWVARPEVTTRGISGLGTVLSGVYIEGAWIPAQNQDVASFAGIDSAPFVRPGQQGTQISIRAVSGNQLAAGAPVLYRGIVAGHIEQPRLSPDGTSVLLNAFVAAPYDRYLTSAARFWDMSGFDIRLGPGGLTLDVASIASLVTGGIAFDNVVEGGEPILPDQTFELFEDEESARNSVFSTIGDNAVTLAIEFSGTLNGLAVGAPVRFRGIDVGEVTAISVLVDSEGNRRVVRLNTLIGIDPQALGLPDGAGEAELLDFLDDAISAGMRARLASQNLFTAALVVELVELPDAEPAELLRRADMPPILPSVVSDIPDVTATAEGVLRRINELPVEDLMAQAISLMASIEALAEEEDTRAAPEALTGLLNDARALIGAEDSQALPGELRAAVADLRAITQELRQEQAVGRLLAAADSAARAAEGIAATSAGLPDLIVRLQALADKANALDAETLVTSATRLIDDADALLASEEVQAVPPALTQALEEVRAIVAELRAAGAVDRLTAALDAAATAAQDVTGATEGVPALVDDLRALTAKAQALDAETLVASATELMDSAEALIGTEAARNVPPALAEALEQIRLALAELREGGIIENANATFASTRRAADSVAEAVEGLPALAERLDQLAGRADALVGTYGARSDFNQETIEMLREVRQAARSVAQLARAIERNPNSLLLGR